MDQRVNRRRSDRAGDRSRDAPHKTPYHRRIRIAHEGRDATGQMPQRPSCLKLRHSRATGSANRPRKVAYGARHPSRAESGRSFVAATFFVANQLPNSIFGLISVGA